MRLENLQDIKECAMEIAEVRETGLVNMYDRRAVANVLYEFGYDFTADHILEDKEDYLRLLDESAKY